MILLFPACASFRANSHPSERVRRAFVRVATLATESLSTMSRNSTLVKLGKLVFVPRRERRPVRVNGMF